MLRRTSGRFEAPVPDYDEEPDRPRRRHVGGRMTTFLLVLVTLVVLGIAVLRVLGIDGNEYTLPALALTPYAAAGAVLLAVLVFALRRRLFALVVLLIAIPLVAVLLPRYFSDDQPAVSGDHLQVMAANLNGGKANAAAIVKAVRDNKVDVLSLVELTQVAVSALDEAGLAAELPNLVFDPGVGEHGAGIASRFPLRKIVLLPASILAEPSAVVDLPGRVDVEMVAVHVPAAVGGGTDLWRRQLADLPPTTPDSRVRVLAGDFNASFDHAAFSRLVDRGYADAAAETGSGLTATWSSWPLGLPITIDHVLVDGRCAVERYDVLDLPGSDHDAVLAGLVLPN